LKIEIKGNELGWIIKLAENHYNSILFRTWIRKKKLWKLDNFLMKLMSIFHPSNFNPGDEEKVWILTDEINRIIEEIDEYESEKEAEKKIGEKKE